MTPEEEAKLREENKNLRDALSNMIPEAGKLSEMIANVENVMGKEAGQLKEVAKSLEAFPAQLAKMAEFMSSPEAKAAMDQFHKTKT